MEAVRNMHYRMQPAELNGRDSYNIELIPTCKLYVILSHGKMSGTDTRTHFSTIHTVIILAAYTTVHCCCTEFPL